MTSPERLEALIAATEYVVKAPIPGAIVECGVWKGGSMMAAALALMNLTERRPLYLYDTFEGMTAPTDADENLYGEPAAALLAREPRAANVWAYAPLEGVRRSMLSTGYDPALIHFVKGPVEDTIPGTAPDQIAILRLDTDWYESTKHELKHLYPRLTRGGVLILDDYGHWAGARKAVDDYFREEGIFPLLCRIDLQGRLVVKV